MPEFAQIYNRIGLVLLLTLRSTTKRSNGIWLALGSPRDSPTMAPALRAKTCCACSACYFTWCSSAYKSGISIEDPRHRYGGLSRVCWGCVVANARCARDAHLCRDGRGEAHPTTAHLGRFTEALKLRGRGERIRTSGLYVPNVALYQTKLRPDKAWILSKKWSVPTHDQ
jgi:hypothetical protein